MLLRTLTTVKLHMLYLVYFQSTNILLSDAVPVRDGVGCLEGGPRPRQVAAEGKQLKYTLYSFKI